MEKTKITTGPGRQRGPFDIEFEEVANDDMTRQELFGTDEEFQKGLNQLMGMNCGLFPTRGEGLE